MSKPTPKELATSGLMNGLAFGVAISSVHLAWGVGLILAMNMPPLTEFAFRATLIELPFGPFFGLLLAPLFALERGKLFHTLALMLVWVAMEYHVTIDPHAVLMWGGPALVAGLIYAIGGWLKKKHIALPIVGAVLLPAVLLSIPVIRTAMAGGMGAVDTSDRATLPDDAPDVVFVVLDTVRAKSASVYGYERDTTPNLEALAKEGVLFENATAPGTWSLPAHASLFTGHFPSSHGTNLEHRYLDDRLPTLAEAMQSAGYQTLAFTANTHISESFGLTRGFDWTDQAWITGAGGRGFTFIFRLVDALGFAAEDKGGGQVARNIEEWLNKRDNDDVPAFVFVNFLEAHFPFHQLPDEFLYSYTEEEESELRDASQIAFGAMFGRALNDEELEQIHHPILDMYDAGVKYSDHLLGRVIAAYQQSGRFDNTVFVVLGDHGEMTGEHGGHGHSIGMYQENLHVPLLFRYPDKISAGTKVSEPVSTVGVYASLLDLAGLSAPKGVQVGSLMPALEGRVAGQPVISEHFEEVMLIRRYGDEVVDAMDPMLSPRGRHRAFRSGDKKLVETTERGTLFFDLANDPDENTNLGGDHPDAVTLAAELDVVEKAIGLPALDGEIGTGVVPEMDAAAMEQLRALGYVE